MISHQVMSIASHSPRPASATSQDACCKAPILKIQRTAAQRADGVLARCSDVAAVKCPPSPTLLHFPTLLSGRRSTEFGEHGVRIETSPMAGFGHCIADRNTLLFRITVSDTIQVLSVGEQDVR